MSAAAPLPGQPLPLRILLDHAVGLTRRHFRTIYPSVAIPLALASGAVPMAQALLMGSVFQPGAPPTEPGQVVVMVGGIVAAVVLFLVVYVIGYGALYLAAMEAAAGRPVVMRDAWKKVIRPEVWGTMLLNWVAVLAGTSFLTIGRRVFRPGAPATVSAAAPAGY